MVSIDELKVCPLFESFTDAGLAIIAQAARLRDVPAGLSVFLQGSPGEGLFIVQEGCVEILVRDGKESRLLCTVEKGGHFGELALLRPGRRAVSARARIACRLVEIRRTEFNETLQQKPQACIKLMLAVFATIERRLEAVRGDLVQAVFGHS